MKNAVTVAALLALVAVSACSNTNNSSSSSASASASAEPSAMASTAASQTAASQTVANANDGGKIFQNNCSSCHQVNGRGVAGAFPPLAGNPVVVGDPTTVIHIVKYGLNGKIHVEGHDYNGMMPAWHQSLSNTDIAAAITYIRSSWGNKASAVTPAAVAAVSQ
jgi:mono/diheme cytochrome c family protein